MAFLHYYKLHNVTRVIYHGHDLLTLLNYAKSPTFGNIIREVLLEEDNYV